MSEPLEQAPNRDDPASPDRDGLASPDRGDPATSDRGDPASPDRGDPATSDQGDPATSDQGDGAVHPGLERWCLRLLAAYPPEHRRVYQAEMLAVLLAGVRPGQRFPALADVADVLLAAGGQRVVGAIRGLAAPAWRDAWAASATLVAVLDAALWFMIVVLDLQRQVDLRVPLPREDLVLGAVALGVAVAVGCGWWRVAAPLGWLLVLGNLLLDVLLYRGSVPPVLPLGVLLLATVAAVAVTVTALASPAQPGSAQPGSAALAGPGRVAPLGWLRVGAAAVVSAGGVALAVAPALYPGGPDWVGRQPMIWELRWHLGLSGMAEVVIVGGLLAVVATLRAEVRRRVLAVLAPPLLVMTAVLAVDRSGYFPWSRLGWLVHFTVARWALVLVGPVVLFAAAVAVLRRRERSLRLLALGREAERRQAAG